MEKVKIYPAKLAGTVQVPSSKSMGHREIICAGLAGGTSIVDNISMSKDIEATMRVLRAMNVSVDEIPSMIGDVRLCRLQAQVIRLRRQIMLTVVNPVPPCAFSFLWEQILAVR